MELHMGTMLPSKVITRQVDGGIEVSAVDPAASMIAIDNVQLKAVAEQIRELLSEMIDAT